jgi:hypothetical protein
MAYTVVTKLGMLDKAEARKQHREYLRQRVAHYAEQGVETREIAEALRIHPRHVARLKSGK